MKRLFGICLLVFAISQCAKADTIDFWHVYLNGEEITEFNEYSKDPIIKLKLNQVKATDSITVKYFRDTPCFECPHFLVSMLHDVVKDSIAKGVGTFEPLIFSLSAIINYINPNNPVSIAYCEGQGKILLFKVEFE